MVIQSDQLPLSTVGGPGCWPSRPRPLIHSRGLARPRPGFGMLFLDTDGRLSTGETPGDLDVDQDGKHARGDKRYQIIRVQSV